MWCPKCKNEYVDGITVCADCGCDLVEALSEEGSEEGSEEEMRQAMEEAIGISGEEAEDIRKLVKGGVYHKSSEKAEDFKSSAYVLIGTGIIGIVLLALLLTEKLPIVLTGFNRYLIGGVLGAMFLLFLILGIQSLKSSKKLSEKAIEEDDLTAEILNWCRANLTAAGIDSGLFEENKAELPEEAKYFKRTERMQEQITAQFLNLDENYLGQLIDEYYQEVFADR